MVPIFLAAITVTTFFEGGSLGRMEQVAPAHVQCAVEGQSDQDGRNRQANWYYFRLDGLPRTEVRIDLTDLEGEYNYRPDSYSVTPRTRPVYSYDNRSWRHFDNTQVTWDDARKHLILRLTPQRGRIWIAHAVPYTTAHLFRLRREIERSPFAGWTSAGPTSQGRDLPLVTVAEGAPPRAVWLMARQHAWETGTSWVIEGALRFLASADPGAAVLRRRFIWKIFPMADPDGVANGKVRFNAQGYDVNRNWDRPGSASTPEIWAMKRAMLAWLDSGQPVDLFLAMHNQESGDYLDGPEGPLATRLTAALARTASFQAETSPRKTADPKAVAAGRMMVHQSLQHERSVPAFLMEMAVEENRKLNRLRSVEDNLQFGRELVLAIGEALGEGK